MTDGRRAPGTAQQGARTAGRTLRRLRPAPRTGTREEPLGPGHRRPRRGPQFSHADRDQLYGSAGLLPHQDGTVSTRIPPGLQLLAAPPGDVPIAVFTADWTLVWWNPTWSALHSGPAVLPSAERNLARALFGNGAAHASMLTVRSERGPSAFDESSVADRKDAVSRRPGTSSSIVSWLVRCRTCAPWGTGLRAVRQLPLRTVSLGWPAGALSRSA
ncbi:hypothetical protein AB0P41_23135 [Streptomyces sp. NPDC079167]|uniref:MmyB family transcriptional regulator n=1 Tax=Streptomyces sp. NPDC079167 TaxID=3154513 RepID=UPI003441996F